MAKVTYIEVDHEIIPSGSYPVVDAQNVQCVDERLDEVLRSIGNDTETADGRISANETNIANNTTAISGLDTRVTVLEESGGSQGTVTSVSVKMNGSTKGTVTSSGTIDLGTVITAHQSLANYVTTSDSRLTDSRNANDVYSWAKASAKPTYTASEVGAAASSHTHSVYESEIEDIYNRCGGGKNLLKFSGSTSTSNGITFTPTYDANGLLEYITANGTNNGSGASSYRIAKGENYIYKDCIFSFETENTNIVGLIGYYNSSWAWKSNVSVANGSEQLIGNSQPTILIDIQVPKGKSVSNAKIYPMLRNKLIPSKSYAKYIPTNEELYAMIKALQ